MYRLPGAADTVFTPSRSVAIGCSVTSLKKSSLRTITFSNAASVARWSVSLFHRSWACCKKLNRSTAAARSQNPPSCLYQRKWWLRRSFQNRRPGGGIPFRLRASQICPASLPAVRNRNALFLCRTAKVARNNRHNFGPARRGRQTRDGVSPVGPPDRFGVCRAIHQAAVFGMVDRKGRMGGSSNRAAADLGCGSIVPVRCAPSGGSAA